MKLVTLRVVIGSGPISFAAKVEKATALKFVANYILWREGRLDATYATLTMSNVGPDGVENVPQVVFDYSSVGAVWIIDDAVTEGGTGPSQG